MTVTMHDQTSADFASSDTKPTMDAGSIGIETDTSRLYINIDGSNWVQIPQDIENLDNVDTTGLGDNNFLKYNSGAAEWQDFDLFGSNNTWTGTNQFDDFLLDATSASVFKLTSTGIQLGSGAAGVDYRITVDGETNDASGLWWDEDNADWIFKDDLVMDTSKQFVIRDTSTFYMQSAVSGTVLWVGGNVQTVFTGFVTIVGSSVVTASQFGTLGDAVWRSGSAYEHQFWCGSSASNTEMTLQPNSLTFNNGATDTGLGWSTSGELDIEIGGTGTHMFDTNALHLGTTTAVSANYDLLLADDGVLALAEVSTPTADTNYGKVYCKTDDRLYFQDGAGNEHIAAGYNVLYEDMYNLSTTLSPYPGRSLVSGASVYVSFRLPPDFNAISGIYARIMPDTTETIQWDVTGHWHADDEIYNAHTDNVLNDTKAVTVNVGTDLDLTAAVDSSTPSPGDTIGIRFISNTSNIRVVSIRLEYT